MYTIRPPYLIEKLYSNLIWRFFDDIPKIYLTFDDGPVPEATPFVLDTLNKYQIKATFFCVGSNVVKYPEIYQRILADGHSVGNHTFSHESGWKLQNFSYFKSVGKCAEYVTSNLFRPPYGKVKRSQIRALKNKYRIIMWDVLSADFDSNVSPQKCYENVIQHTRNGSIIVFHDSIKAKKNMEYALPKAIEYLKNEGFQFVAIP